MSQVELNNFPNFFIVGAPKAGTTSLYYYLDAHPEVFMSSIKEPNYFSYQATADQQLYYKEKGIATWDKYIALFKSIEQKKAIGEASVSYLFYPEAAKKIKEKFPKARIIIMLRNPIERAISHYNMDYKLGYIDCSLENAIQKKDKSDLNKLYYQQFIQLGFYFEQVKRYIELFGQENVLIIYFEDINNNTQLEVEKLFHFLGVDSHFQINTTARYNTFKTPRNYIIREMYRIKSLRIALKNLLPEKLIDLIKNIILTKNKKRWPKESTISFLKELYKLDIQKLEKLLNRNLKSWYE